MSQADPQQVLAGQVETLARLAQRGEGNLARDFFDRLDPGLQPLVAGLLHDRGVILPPEAPALTPSHDPHRPSDVHTHTDEKPR